MWWNIIMEEKTVNTYEEKEKGKNENKKQLNTSKI